MRDSAMFATSDNAYTPKRHEWFLKVSKFEFLKSSAVLTDKNGNNTEVKMNYTNYSNIKLPRRATKHSAGYDIFSPVDFVLGVGEQIKIPLGIRIDIPDWCFLMICPRSGMGSKYRVQLNNTIGVVDADYFYSDNEGHMFARIINDNREGKTLEVKSGDGILQGIVVPFITNDLYDNQFKSVTRNGGFGSTDMK